VFQSRLLEHPYRLTNIVRNVAHFRNQARSRGVGPPCVTGFYHNLGAYREYTRFIAAEVGASALTGEHADDDNGATSGWGQRAAAIGPLGFRRRWSNATDWYEVLEMEGK
jgi:hypothetical protein